MPFLIDGDNLLGTWRGRDRNDDERRALAGEVSRALAGRRVLVVYDGVARDGSGFAGAVRFSGPRRTADDVILEILDREETRAGWVVVTSDRSLADRCRHRGARIERCDQFRRRLTTGGPPEKPERVEDLRSWLEAFGETVSEASPPSPRRPPRAPLPDDER